MEPNLQAPVSHPPSSGMHPRSHMAYPKTKYVCKYMKIDVYESRINNSKFSSVCKFNHFGSLSFKYLVAITLCLK
jgi:hypothetical protein